MPFTLGLSGGLKITLAGQDISNYVFEPTILIKSTLGQGAGTGSGSSGRSATAEFIAYLGPLYGAIGAGSNITFPQLVRMGEVKIYNSSNNLLFGGYAAKFTDQLGKTPQSRAVKIECYDYWQHLDRVNVNMVVDGLTDIQVIKQALSQYAPWISQVALPASAAFQFGPKNFRNVTLQKALQTVADTTGYQIWVTPDKIIHYDLPTNAPQSPYALSETPNFTTSFQMQVTDVEIDDTAAINRVFFYGGKVPSDNFTQDLSPFVNGNNTIFPLAYYPRRADDGKLHVFFVQGHDLVVGSATGTNNAANTFKSKGGLCDVLVNYDAHTLIFDVAPPAGSHVYCTYRYELPLVTTVSDYTSYQLYGMWLDGAISDNTVVERQEAIQRARVTLNEQSRGLTTVKLTCWKPGLQIGQLLRIDHNTRGIHDNLVIQEIDIVPKGGGNYEFQLTLGAWNWNLVDAIKQSAAFSTPVDDNTDETTLQLDAPEVYNTVKLHDSLTTTTHATGQFYARSTPLNDGHDAFPGFCSITS